MEPVPVKLKLKYRGFKPMIKNGTYRPRCGNSSGLLKKNLRKLAWHRPNKVGS